MFKQVQELVFPDLVLHMKNIKDPQDQEQKEERKIEASLAEEVSDECRKFEDA